MKKVVENTENELPNGYKNISELPEDFTVVGESPSDGWVKLNKGIVEDYSLKYDEYVVTKYKDKDVKVSKRVTLASTIPIPDEYKEVEYLESTGTQYINTGYIPSIGDIYNIRFANIKENDNEVLMGCRSNGDYQTSTDQIYLNLTGNNTILSFAGTISQKKENRIQNKNYEITFGSNDGNFSNNAIQPIYIFALNDKGTTIANAYSKVNNFKIYNNNELVRNLVPVIRKSDNKPGMLDMANLSKNLFDENYENISANLVYKPIYVGDGTFTLSTDIPNSSNKHLFLIGGNVNSGASSGTNGVSITISRTVEAIDGYVTIVYRSSDYTSDPRDCHTMLNKGSTALPYEPYKKSFYTNEGTGEFIAGPKL